MSSLIKELFLKSNLLVFIINNLYIEENTPKNICSVYKHMRFTSNLEIILEIQWNLSTPTYTTSTKINTVELVQLDKVFWHPVT
jgi:hypothetical protein